MTPTALFTLGTPLEGWGPVAQELLARAPAGVDLKAARFRDCFDALVGDARSLAVPALAAGQAPAEAVAKLAALAAGSASPWGGLDARAVWALDTLAAQHPRAAFLAFVESPTDALAAWLAAGAPGDVQAALDLWCAGAERLLRHAQRHPARCLLIAAEEARRWPGLATEVCRDRLGLGFKEPGADLSWPPVDALTALVAQTLVDRHPRAQGLFAELHLACLPLSDDAALAAPPGPLHEPAAAVAALQALATTRAEAEQLAAQHQALQAEAQRTAAECAALKEENDEVLKQLHAVQEQEAARLVEISGLRAERDQLRTEREALVQAQRAVTLERDNTQAEVERLRAEEALLKRELAASREAEQGVRTQVVQLEIAGAGLAEKARGLEAERQQAQQRLAALQLEHTSLQTQRDQLLADHQALTQSQRATTNELDATRQRLAALQTERDAGQKRIATLETDLRSAQREGQVLRGQLHEVQAALELQHQATLRLDERLPYHVAAGQAGVSVGAVTIVTAHETPPHRGLDVELTAVKPGNAPAFALTARLVEHHGRAGLVVFQGPGQPPPLQPWQVSGQEGERAFMLLMPDDPASQRVLAAFGTQHWLLLNTIVAQIDKAVRVDPVLPPRWRVVSRQLRQGLDALPHPLRYDRVQAEAPAGGPGMGLRFDGVECGGRVLRGLQLRYTPQGAGGGVLELLARRDAPEGPPLDGWPVADDGSLAPSVAFNVGQAGNRAERQQQWLRQWPGDRELLLALLAALPGAAAQAGIASPAAPPADLHAQALRDLQPSLLRRVARALRGRRPAAN